MSVVTNPTGAPHKVVSAPCPGECGRMVRYDRNTNHARPPYCMVCIARLRREIEELVERWIVAERGAMRR